jgi:hypothetical protein
VAPRRSALELPPARLLEWHGKLLTIQRPSLDSLFPLLHHGETGFPTALSNMCSLLLGKLLRAEQEFPHFPWDMRREELFLGMGGCGSI